MTISNPHYRRVAAIMTLTIALLCASVVRADELAKPKELHVLFIGNSQVYYNDLPHILEALADSAPADAPRIRTDRFVPGGASLESHWNRGAGKGTAQAKTVEQKWDYVILQEIYNAKAENFNKYAPLFHELIQ